MLRSPRPQDPSNAAACARLRKVRKGTRSCWECKRRKVRCIFSSGSTGSCDWCLSHDSNCVSQRYLDTTENTPSIGALQERIVHMESLLRSLVQKLEDRNLVDTEKEDRRTPSTTVQENSGIDVLDPASFTTGHSSSVVSIFQNSSFPLEIGDKTVPATPVDFPSSNPSMVAHYPGNALKLEKVSRLLLEMMPSRETIEVLDRESSRWISQLLPGIPTLSQFGEFSLLKAMPFESSTVSHPAIIARALMCMVVCLQQLPRSFDFARLRLSSSANEFAASLRATVCALVTSDDEIVATPEGIECLNLQAISFINTGKPRRAWLSNRRALAVAQVMGLHSRSKQTEQDMRSWQYLVHSDRYLAIILAFPYGTVELDGPFTLTGQLPEKQQELAYLRELDQIAARVIDREQSSKSLAYVATQSIDNVLENLAQSVPQHWWHIPENCSELSKEALGMIYNQLNIQLYHYQLALTLHLPFLLDLNANRKYDYNRFSCLNAARELIKVYLVLQSTFGMFSCLLVNFQAFTAAVILIYNLFTPHPTFEIQDLSGQMETDWSLINDVIITLDRSTGTFHDTVASQASDILKLLQKLKETPQNLGGDRFDFAIPYFGSICIARRPRTQNTDEAMAMNDVGPEDSSEFMATFNMLQPVQFDEDELLQQWLIDDANWPY